MARFRLRFLLQEFDLPQGDTLLGRSADCHVTIEDPLVSRQHARVRIDGDAATVEDLGSRNGVRVNGARALGPTQLAHNDRVRIGTQELVFCKVPAGAADPTKRTGFLRHCGGCGTPFPEEMIACPSCGWVGAAISLEATSQDDARPSWTTQLLLEVLTKAVALDRVDDAERIMARVVDAVDERLASPGPADRALLDALSQPVMRLGLLQASARWLGWLLDVYSRVDWAPPRTFLEALAALPESMCDELGDVVSRVGQAVNEPIHESAESTVERDEIGGARDA